MNIKQKLENAKSKIKEYAPEIIVYGTSITIAALAAYALNKKLDFDLLLVKKSDPEGVDNNVKLVTGEDREKIVGDDSFELYYVEDDFYFLSPKKDNEE